MNNPYRRAYKAASTDDVFEGIVNGRPEWQNRAACSGIADDTMFPKSAEEGMVFGSVYREARNICRGCPVAEACLKYALTNGETHGMWGGMTPKERKKLPRVTV